MSLLQQLGAELNGWVTAVGGVAVVITISVIMQKLHERKMRKLQLEQLRIETETLQVLQRIEKKIGRVQK